MSIKNYILAKLELGFPVKVIYIEPINHEPLSGTVIGYDTSWPEPWIIQCDESNDFKGWDSEDIADMLRSPCKLMDDPRQFVEMVGDPVGGLLLRKTQKSFIEGLTNHQKELWSPEHRPIKKDGEIVGFLPPAPKFSFPEEELPTIGFRGRKRITISSTEEDS